MTSPLDGLPLASKQPPSSTGYPTTRCRITVQAGLRHVAADQGLEAMGAAGVSFYQRGGALVRVSRVKAKASDKSPILVPGIVPVRLSLLRRALGQSAYWEKPNKDGELFRIDPPKEVAEMIAEMVEEWPFEPLAGVIGCPTLRPDGSLLDKPGYDEATGLVLENGFRMPPIPIRPTMNEAITALALLDDLLDEFPFADEASRSVARSQLITPVVRGAMIAAPMHLTTAPEAGSGKSYLADIATTLATGERCPVIALSGNPDESEKRLVGAALSGFPVVSIDNASQVLTGDFLCQATERPVLWLRKFGALDLYRVANTFTVFANGNNLAVGDDVVRRTIRCALDANLEVPESRCFYGDPLAMLRADRGAYVAACLIISLAYRAAGMPGRLTPLPSYEGWSDNVRSPLVWLGCADPLDTVTATRADDPVRATRGAVFHAWRDELILGDGYTVAELIGRAQLQDHLNGGAFLCPQLRAALLALPRGKAVPAYQIDPIRLGMWLKKQRNTVVQGHKLVVDLSDSSRPRYRLARQSE